eukprot:762369-Prymnesium_polylepis.1
MDSFRVLRADWAAWSEVVEPADESRWRSERKGWASASHAERRPRGSTDSMAWMIWCACGESAAHAESSDVGKRAWRTFFLRWYSGSSRGSLYGSKGGSPNRS